MFRVRSPGRSANDRQRPPGISLGAFFLGITWPRNSWLANVGLPQGLHHKKPTAGPKEFHIWFPGLQWNHVTNQGIQMIQNGEWTVVNASGAPVGRVDGDEFIRQGANLLYRIDGNEIYTVGSNAQLVANIDGETARSPQTGQVVLRFLRD